MAERAGIEPATDGTIRPLLVLKTSRTTRSILSTPDSPDYTLEWPLSSSDSLIRLTHEALFSRLGRRAVARNMPVFDFEADSVVEGLLNDGPKYKADPAAIMIAPGGSSDVR